jgi:ADP-ribosylglycohydrolase
MGGKTLAYQITSLLLGIAAGDALGVPVEFRPRGSFRVRDMQGYGTHSQPPGTWSDDTSLALCLADSLSRGFDLSDIA